MLTKKLLVTFFFALPLTTIISCTSTSLENRAESRNKLLTNEKYNNLVDQLEKKSNNLAIAVIYNNKSHIEFVEEEKGKSLWFYMHNKLKYIDFKYRYSSKYGIWIGPFFFKNDPLTVIKGGSENKNYDMMGYPLLYYNHKYAQLGASNYHPKAGEIIEVTYNHEN